MEFEMEGPDWETLDLFFPNCIPIINSYTGLANFGSSHIKGTLSGLRKFLAIESPLKMMKNAFYFTSKAFFILKIFKLLSWFFGYVAQRLDLKSLNKKSFYDEINSIFYQF